jgi:hypothetical protein
MTFIPLFFKLLGQYCLNWLNLLDHMGNTFLMGDANETMSARTARARNAGSKPACWFCNFLTWAAKVVTFGKVNRDHCDYALDASVLPNSKEIWDWNRGTIRKNPVTEVDDSEIGPQ